MHVNDLAEVISVLGKLNRTIDETQAMLDQYVAKFGPPQVAFAEETQQKAPAEQNGHDPERAKVEKVVEEGLAGIKNN